MKDGYYDHLINAVIKAEGHAPRKEFKMIRLTMDQLEGAAQDYCGFCISCGEEQSGVEPDARKYTCLHCGLHTVFGAEQIVLEDLAIIIEEDGDDT